MDPFIRLIAVGYIINFILIIVVVCFQRRDPTVSVAWVLCFISLPILGAVLFLIFGLGLKRRTVRRYAQKLQTDTEYAKKLFRVKSAYEIDQDESIQFPDMVKYFSNVANSVYSTNNDVKVFTDAREKYDWLLKDIAEAKETINFLYFIIRDDAISNTILAALAKKANEGVEVRFMYDSFGSILTSRRIFRKLKHARKGQVAEFFPMDLFSLSKINHRNHRKIVVIDGRIAYLGGMNIGDEYMGKKKPTPWRDTHLRLTGTAVADVQKYFCLDWEFSTGEKLTNDLDKFFHKNREEQGNTPVQIVGSGPDSPEEEVKDGMIKILNHARQYTYIQTPYFVPDKAFMTAIRMAAQSGVDVRVMIPGAPDKPYVYYTTMSYMGELLDAGIRVFLYPGFIHSKTIVADDALTTIGTTNIDIRSFVLHFEINAFLYGEQCAVENRDIFLKDQYKCVELTKEAYDRRGVWNIMKEGFFRLFSQVM